MWVYLYSAPLIQFFVEAAFKWLLKEISWLQLFRVVALKEATFFRLHYTCFLHIFYCEKIGKLHPFSSVLDLVIWIYDIKIKIKYNEVGDCQVKNVKRLNDIKIFATITNFRLIYVS